jgi:GDP-4-dehydro-6-deoxy-D-mannose reductase
MKALVTGATGMIGSHFAHLCRLRGWETFGVARNTADSRLSATPDISVFRCDILDRQALADVVAKVRPDVITHFAAQAFNGLSWQCEECPLVEERLLCPVSTYGISKVATECLGFQYFLNFGLKVYLPRLFIHVGTGHPPATAIQNFAPTGPDCEGRVGTGGPGRVLDDGAGLCGCAGWGPRDASIAG